MSLNEAYNSWDRKGVLKYQRTYDLRRSPDNLLLELDIAEYTYIKNNHDNNKFLDLSMKMSQINVDNGVATDSVTLKVTVCPDQDG